MAFISVETKSEVTMVKILSSMNQILLCHCFVMMILGLLFMADSEAADYDLEEDDYEESEDEEENEDEEEYKED